ncbi:hypothetical protein WG929_20630, partial [Oceanobacter sp. wDCs-4]
PETATLQERYHSILQNCRRLNGINVLLKRSILDNWVENYRVSDSMVRTASRLFPTVSTFG